MHTLLQQLRTDFGKRTLGELIQDREAAAAEIERLMRELTIARNSTRTSPPNAQPLLPTSEWITRGQGDGRGVLLRLTQVCEIVALSRSTIYSAMREGRFPSPIAVGARSVRWKATDVASWVAAKEAVARR